MYSQGQKNPLALTSPTLKALPLKGSVNYKTFSPLPIVISTYLSIVYTVFMYKNDSYNPIYLIAQCMYSTLEFL